MYIHDVWIKYFYPSRHINAHSPDMVRPSLMLYNTWLPLSIGHLFISDTLNHSDPTMSWLERFRHVYIVMYAYIYNIIIIQHALHVYTWHLLSCLQLLHTVNVIFHALGLPSTLFLSVASIFPLSFLPFPSLPLFLPPPSLPLTSSCYINSYHLQDVTLHWMGFLMMSLNTWEILPLIMVRHMIHYIL